MSFRSLICTVGATVAGLAVVAPAAMATTIAGDFDNDGVDDLAVGAPREDVGPEGSEVANAGAVNVIYGAAAGISGDRHQFWHQDRAGIEEVANGNDSFGAALASGDLNGDGFDDLAIGVPGEDVGGAPILNAGAVNVLYGSSGGLRPSGNHFRVQRIGATSDAESGDRFGFALAVADFKGGPEADLAVGAPFEDFVFPTTTRGNSGRVSVHEGGAGGVAASASSNFTSSSIENGDHLGTALAAGQFGSGAIPVGVGGKADVVAGAPEERPPGTSVDGAGAVEVFYIGSSSFSRQVLSEVNLGITAEAGDSFGSAVAVGEFGDGGRDDLAVGAPLEDIEADGASNAGIVGVFYGVGESLSTAVTDVWDQENAGVGTIESGDNFGAALTTGDFGRSQLQDLAIGSPLEDIVESGNEPDAGFVAVLYGDATGLAGPGDARVPFNFNYGPIAGAQLGAALGAGDFGSGARDDLAAGVPLFPQFPDAPQFNGPGLVGILYGRSTGVSQGVVPGELELFDQDEVGGAREPNDQFGAALAPAAGRTLFKVP